MFSDKIQNNISMSNRKISYINRDFNDFRNALISYTKEYYPEIAESLDDASIGSWLIDMVAGVSDSLSYHIDRSFQETQINSAQQMSSLYNLARSNGVKIPGPKGSITELKLSCILPVNYNVDNSVSTSRTPNWVFAPIVKRGTKFSNGTIVFELDHDIDFGQAFDFNGVPNRTIEIIKNSNDVITGFKVSKYFVITAGYSRVYKQEIKSDDVVPFMEVMLPYKNIMEVKSIIFKDGTNHSLEPTTKEFMIEEEFIPAEYTQGQKDIYRFFEVDSLIQPYRWGTQVDNKTPFEPKVATYGFVDNNGKVVPTSWISRGEWKPLKQKFMTEYTDDGYMKIIFGAGHKYKDEGILGDEASFSKHLISKMVNNDALGVTPRPNTTMYILYRIGDGANSNLPIDSIKQIQNLNISFDECRFPDLDSETISQIRNSFTVTNTTEAVSGRDMLSGEELRNYIKYNKGAQDRCVTINDYKSRILQMPASYGTPYRLGVTEENNKIMIYLLGIDYNGKLTSSIPSAFITNLQSYLSEYRMINDFIEMKSGRVLNISFEIDCYINKSYNSADIISSIIKKVKDYMSIDKREMGDDIFLGDLEKEISMLDGVKNLIDLRAYNEFGISYSQTQTTQACLDAKCVGATQGEVSMYRKEIDLNASDHILYSENDTMIEIKYPDRDIKVRVKLK